jgi:hypothetical protein
MLTCNWANALTRYDCHPVRGLRGESGLEIATPFALPGGSPITLYLIEEGTQILISDNGDTLFSLSTQGVDVFHAARIRSLRELATEFKVTLSPSGDFRVLSTPDQASRAFATAVSSLLAVSRWASKQMKQAAVETDLAAEAEPYIVARDPSAQLIHHPKILGASRAEHVFAFQHGNDLIDVISPYARSTGTVMRKVGDVVNGPFVEELSPLIIVDDRVHPDRAAAEIGIIASISRAQPFTSLQRLH